MVYRYETHCHTADGSRCSTLEIKDMAEMYRGLGYAGICVTDHFSGMTVVPDETPWKERVAFCFDLYEKIRRAGEKAGLSVFWGSEYSLAEDIRHLTWGVGNDFLFYNLSKSWFLENKSAFCGKPSELFKRIREAGGFITHAHPFLEAGYIECVKLFPRGVDAVEVLNVRNSDFMNGRALDYARAYGLLEVAGSDCHSAEQRVFAGVETDMPCSSAGELADKIRKREARVFTVERE